MKQNSATTKHILIRSIILLFLFIYFGSIALLALAYLSIETVYFFKKNNKTLAIANLAILGFLAFVILILFLLSKGYKS